MTDRSGDEQVYSGGVSEPDAEEREFDKLAVYLPEGFLYVEYNPEEGVARFHGPTDNSLDEHLGYVADYLRQRESDLDGELRQEGARCVRSHSCDIGRGELPGEQIDSLLEEGSFTLEEVKQRAEGIFYVDQPITVASFSGFPDTYMDYVAWQGKTGDFEVSVPLEELGIPESEVFDLVLELSEASGPRHEFQEEVTGIISEAHESFGKDETLALVPVRDENLLTEAP